MGSWTQLGLFCDARTHLSPKALRIALPRPHVRSVPRSKPIRKKAPLLAHIALTELDDPIDDLFTPQWYLSKAIDKTALRGID